MNALTTTTGFNALSPQQQEDHRAKIGVRAEVILKQFWRDDEISDAERALEIEAWMDVLQTCSHSEIRNAWAEYMRTGPRTQAGKLYKPDAGALYRIVMKARPRPAPVRTYEPEPEERAPRITPERMKEIMDEKGLGPAYHRPKAFPKPPKLPDEERRMIEEAKG